MYVVDVVHAKKRTNEQPSEQQTCQQVHECLNKHTEQTRADCVKTS